ncbi:tagatose-bisphosphate aldolase [bacterium]|nr:tagatose-bisphosphate aldolase [bacterium]
MKSLIEVLREAEKKRVAIGHFNFSTIAQLRAIVSVARKLDKPIVLGLSEGERSYFGLKSAVHIVRNLRSEGLPIFLNADHTYNLGGVREAAEAGVDSIIFDGAKLSYKENEKKTKQAVKLVKDINPDILIEGELGYIGESSKVLDAIPDKIDLEHLPTVDQAKYFVDETGVDMLAPAVGNIHGMFGKAKNPRLQIDRIHNIKDAVKIPLVLHGGSGVTDEDFQAAIKSGISLIHISTEIRAVWRESLEQILKKHPKEIAPYKLMSSVVRDVEGVVEERVRLFSKTS